MTETGLPRLGVVIVAYRSAAVIEGCLSSLLTQTGVGLDIIVVQNGRPDGTSDAVRTLARATPAQHRIDLIETGTNLGFAGGVNRGLGALRLRSHLDRFWILNPDTRAEPGCARAFATDHAGCDFALMGGRVLYADPPHAIQIDGGTIDRRWGRTGNVNLGQPRTSPPPEAARIDFVTGASMVASRRFLDQAGPMEEGYFLYYEEVDWALRRGTLPLLYCAEAVVLHEAGTAIGSPTLDRGASTFSLWFKHRARMAFVQKHLPSARTGAQIYSLGKAAQSLTRGDLAGAYAILSGSFGWRMPRSVRRRLGETQLPSMGQSQGWP